VSRSLAAGALVLLHLARWARNTRPEPLPPCPEPHAMVTTSDGRELHVEVGGIQDSDLTVVLVHGFLARSTEFDLQWAALHDRARLVRFDHRNHGRSTHTVDAVHLDRLAQDLLEVIEQVIPTGRVVIVGHSMGGIATIALAQQRPDLFAARVAGVALISAAAGHDLTEHRNETRFRHAARRHLLDGGLGALRAISPALEHLRPRRTHTMRAATKTLMFGTQDIDPATLAMTQALLEEPPLATLASMQGALLRTDVRAGLDALKHIPVLVLTGSDDRLIRPAHSRRMAADIGPSAVLVEIDGAGHVVNQTRPTEVNAALHHLLDRTGAIELSTLRHP
jgi:pimeloyl-ACP methyl ester carboxylesterase